MTIMNMEVSAKHTNDTLSFVVDVLLWRRSSLSIGEASLNSDRLSIAAARFSTWAVLTLAPHFVQYLPPDNSTPQTSQHLLSEVNRVLPKAFWLLQTAEE